MKKESKNVTTKSHLKPGRKPKSLDVLLTNKRGFAAALARMIHARRSRYPDINMSDYLAKVTGWAARNAFRLYASSETPSQSVMLSLTKEFPELRNYWDAMGLHTLGTIEVIAERITELSPKTQITMFLSSIEICFPNSSFNPGELYDILARAIVNNQCTLRIVAPDKVFGGFIKANVSWKVRELSVSIRRSVQNKISMLVFDTKLINIPHTFAFFFNLFGEEKESSGLLYIEGINPLIAPPSFPMCGWIYLTEVQFNWYRNALKALK